MLRMSGLFAGTPFERPVTCEHCGKAVAECSCPRGGDGKVLPPSGQSPRVQREKRGGGKIATIIRGLDPHATDLLALLKELRKSLACGGSLDDGVIELQGDHRDRVVELLVARGYKAKTAGG